MLQRPPPKRLSTVAKNIFYGGGGGGVGAMDIIALSPCQVRLAINPAM